MLPGKENDLIFYGPVSRWDEAIPLGNGMCGCLVWGDGKTLRLSLNRGDLWENTPCLETQRPDFNYAVMIDMVREKRWEDLRQLFDVPYRCPYPTKLPAGRILFEMGECEAMESRLSLDDALATVKLELSDGPLTIQTFLHQENRAGFLLMDRMPEALSWRVQCPEYSFGPEKQLSAKRRYEGDNELSLFTYPEPTIVEQCDTKGFLLSIEEDFHYGIVMHHVSVENGELFVWEIGAETDISRLYRPMLEKLTALAEVGFEKNLLSNAEWWHRYWEKSGLRISDKLYEKNWYITNYLLGACSRKGCPPMALQGVWTADDNALPPWKGDYHHDLNTQLSYYSYLKANRLEAGESFLDFLWDLLPTARKFAREFFGAEGICLPSVMTMAGQPICGWPMYSFSPTCQLWLCQMFERHYRYTMDEAFLRDRAYPYMKESAQFILSLLKESEDGMLYLPLSSSPEIHDNRPKAWLTPNSNFDLSLMRYLFTQLADLADLAAPEEKGRWAAALEKLPQLAVSEETGYRMAPDEDLNESHRHFSHVMALYPLKLVGYDTPEHKKVIDATVNHLELLGSGLWVGYSFPWMAHLYVLQGNGEGAAAQLEIFWHYFCSASNGFHLNGDYKKGGFCTWHYRPFTLEANMFAADALQEMLLCSDNTSIELFPAVPERFESVEFESFRTQNGLLVSAKMEKKQVISVHIHAERPCKVILKKGASPMPTYSGLSCEAVRDAFGNLQLSFA